MASGKDVAATPADTANYIGGIAKELRALAIKANLGFLAYLLAMAEDEAMATSRRQSEDKQRS